MCHSSIRPHYVHLRHLHMTSFTRPSPVLVLQATNAGVRRPGNEATSPCHAGYIYVEYLFQHFLMVETALIGINVLWCETAKVRCNRLQDFQQCELIGIQFHAGSARPSSPFRVSVREGLAARLHSDKTSS